MTIATVDTTRQAQRELPPLRGALALSLQEAFTAAIRLRANRQVAADAASFRTQIKQLLAAADAEARRLGYDGSQVKLAVFAFIAFLDESVLNSTQPMFADWPRQPLQEEIFGEHMAGETFFRHLDGLLAQQDSEALADVLEVYQLCLLLGFRGRYGAGGPGALASLTGTVQEKIRRVRGSDTVFAPRWQLPDNDVVVVLKDPWIARLGLFCAVTFLLAAALYLVFRFSLASDVDALRGAVEQLVR
jgi:type VI secretion system protein ImpK